jgi:hypothetical protein
VSLSTGDDGEWEMPIACSYVHVVAWVENGLYARFQHDSLAPD